MPASGSGRGSASREDIDPRYIVPGLSRGLALLQLFPRSKPAKTLAELAAGLGLTRSATYRLVYTLEADGFIARDAETRRYRLTSKTLDLGFEYLHAQPMTEIAQPFLRVLSDRTNAAAHVAILDGWHAVYLARALPNAGLVSNLQLGARLPAHTTSSGRVMLAHQDDERLRVLYDRLRKELRGAHAVPSAQDFQGQIAADRKRGYVFHHSTVDPGLVSLAFPIRDHDSRVIAAVTVIVPEKLSEAIGGERALRPMVYETADAISRKIGYRG
ncbi:IclR family transcriptional regulator [Pseudorhodoplanes sp.]|uniref:IclR family transcriptional regulator n=1 Tax=Pseudorhodoplanes sp. TaxID=1934341 RepID=UPI002B636B5B|nr:IclR family transcriptional regulator [Pseudorhodoplanes sp.]HWV42520.1 IclR family transcriptional regulator [Pseudorhodoplanes sp.]